MFLDYQSKPITRSAYKVLETDFVSKLVDKESTSCIMIAGKAVAFKHYEPVNTGDYIVHLNADDVYHCTAAVFAERNELDAIKQDSVNFEHVQAMVDSLTFQYARIGETTTTVCEAFLPSGFSVGSGKSACVNPANYSYADSCKYARERAAADAKETIWQLEGYLLAITGKTSDRHY